MPIKVGFRNGQCGRLLHVVAEELGSGQAWARCGAGLMVADPAPRPGEFTRWCPACTGQKPTAFAGVWRLTSE
ncbi:hypothetical protein STREPTOSP366_44160 [Streptomyces variabilis]